MSDWGAGLISPYDGHPYANYHVKCMRGICGEGRNGESYVCPPEGCYDGNDDAVAGAKRHRQWHYRMEAKARKARE